MVLASEVEILTPRTFDAFLGIARAVRSLAPNPADEAARLGLIHLALRRKGREGRKPPSDSLSRAIQDFQKPSLQSHDLMPDPDDARVLALTLLAYAGDLPDPAGEADLVVRHDEPVPELASAAAVSLLGPYVFLNTSPDN